jgi:hypothetical protein
VNEFVFVASATSERTSFVYPLLTPAGSDLDSRTDVSSAGIFMFAGPKSMNWRKFTPLKVIAIAAPVIINPAPAVAISIFFLIPRRKLTFPVTASPNIQFFSSSMKLILTS